MTVRAVPPFTEAESAVLAALVDVVVPPDDAPGGWAGGTERLLREHAEGFMSWAVNPLRSVVEQAETAARARGSRSFLDLPQEARLAVLDELRDALDTPLVLGTGFGSFVDRKQLTPVAALVMVTYEGFYGGTREPAGWAVTGFRPVPDGVVPVDPELPVGIDAGALDEHYEVVVIGAGAGGGAVAAELAEGGRRVLLVDRSLPMRASALRSDHLRGKRMAAYDVTAGPGAGSPRVLEHADGTTSRLDSDGDGGAYGLVAMTLGGGSRLWEGMAWRFYPEDFQMASIYGTPEDSTLSDWPFDYAELAPYYDRAEWELGVSGEAEGALGTRTPRMRELPMPALPDDDARRVLSRAADDLGWRPTPIPFAINSVPRAGRPACVRCSQCIGHACPVDAKNGTQNTFIPRALATGRTDLLHGAQALSIEHDGRGRASGVRLAVEDNGATTLRTVRADTVVVAAGALETPRLLLASALGNSWVGRNHHSHGIAVAVAARTQRGAKTDVGPGHSVATLEHVHHDGEAWGGGVLFDMLPAYPLGRAFAGMNDSGHRYGVGHKHWMRNHSVQLGAMSMVQEIPHAATRLTLDPTLRDRHGMPALRLRGEPHPASVEAAEYMAAHAEQWVRQAGGRGVYSFSGPGSAQGSEHSAGTARMGKDPAASACDERGRLHGTSNVYVADASLHPTNGGFNPGLTVIANALRVGRLIVEN